MTPTRSTFVTVLAWVFIVIAGFATFISTPQVVMVVFYFPTESFHEAKPLPPEFDDAPALVRLKAAPVARGLRGVQNAEGPGRP